MSAFIKCIPFVLNHECFINDKGDLISYYEDKNTGEESNFGVSAKLLSMVSYWTKDPKDLSKEDAINFYFFFFWDRWRLQSITSNNVAAKIFDMMVNMGPHRAALIAQKAMNFEAVATDGVFGPNTLYGLNKVNEHDMLDKLTVECLKFYTEIAVGDNEKNLALWVKRASDKPKIEEILA